MLTYLNTAPPSSLSGLVSSDPWRTGITGFHCDNNLRVAAGYNGGTPLYSADNSLSVSNWFYSG